jgi:hypothetical protein
MTATTTPTILHYYVLPYINAHTYSHLWIIIFTENWIQALAQEQTIQTTREIADNYIESQKEIISIYQSVWTPFVENANSRFWNYWSISPRGIAETYGTVVSSFADNVIAATRLTNNAVSANMELFSTALQQTKDNSRELSRLGINAAKVFHETSNGVVSTQFSIVETVPLSRPPK